MAAGEIGTEDIPGELEQFHFVVSVPFLSRPAHVEDALGFFIIHDRHIGWHLQHAAAGQFADAGQDFVIILRRKINRCLHVAPVVAGIAAVECFMVLDLAGYHGRYCGVHGGQVINRVSYRRYLVCAHRFGDTLGDAEQQLQL